MNRARLLRRIAVAVAVMLVPAVTSLPAHAQPPRSDRDVPAGAAGLLEARWPRTSETQPDGWSQLPQQVKANLSSGPLLPFPVSSPNVRVSDPAGDQPDDAQSFVSVAAWGRFVLAVWIDTRGAEGSPGLPPTTEIGYATSCDWGATFSDGGSVPRVASNDQTFHPTLSSDGRGNFYLAGTYLSQLDGTGAPGNTAIGFWKGGFDTTACTFSWNPALELQQTPASPGSDQIDRVRVVADPFDDAVHIIYVIRRATSKDVVAAISSPNAGAIWGPSRTIANGLGTGVWFVGVPDAAIGPNHEIYVVWSDRMVWVACEYQSPQFVTPDGSQVYFSKSVNHGSAWSAETAISPLFSTFLSGGPTDLTGQIKVNPRIAVDRSTAATRGNVYVTWPASASWVAEPALDSTTVELEPNGAPNGARPLLLGESGAGISASTADVDYWRVNLTAGQTLLARIEPQDWACGSFSTSYGFLLQLLTSPSNGAIDISDSLLQSSNFSGFVSQVVFTCRRSGTYYLRVQQNTLGTNINYVLRTRSVVFGQQAGSGRDEGDILLSRSTTAGSTWGQPIIVNADAPLGFQETGPSIAVDASGRVLVGWHDHRESETDPVSVGMAQLTDSYLAESGNGGTSFGAGQRVSDARNLMGQNQREVFYSTGLHTDLVADGDHLLMGWDDQRLATRATNSVDAFVQFADREVPAIAFVEAPAESVVVGSDTLAFSWQGSDRRTAPGALRYSRSLENLTTHTFPFRDLVGAETSTTLLTSTIPADGWYEFSVSALDEAGNLSAAPVRRRFQLDAAPPFITILSGPATGSFVGPSVSFVWTGTDATVGPILYSFRLDGGPWSEFGTTTSTTVHALAAGAHQFEIRAQDARGNVGTHSCAFNSNGLVSFWAADSSGADVRGVSEAQLRNGATYGAGIAGKAFEVGPGNAHALIPHVPAHDPGTGSFSVAAWFRASSIVPGAAMSIFGKNEAGVTGSTTYEVYYFAGQLRFFVRDRDGGGNSGGGQLLAPSAPSLATPGGWHMVVAERDQAAGRLRLYLDGAALADTPTNAGASGDITFLAGTPEHRGLSLGLHYFESPAGAVGNPWLGQIDEPAYFNRALTAAEVTAMRATRVAPSCPDSAVRAFTVDVTPPNTAITSGPVQDTLTNADPITLGFSGTDDVALANQLQYRWSLDNAPLSSASLSTSASFSGTAEGPHTFRVFAIDPAGNSDPTPAERSFTVDRTPPETQISGGPAAGAIVSTNVLTYNWSGTDDRTPAGGVRFQYRLDGGAFSGPTTALVGAIANVPDGPHMFAVRALDLAGNADPSPDTRAVTVDVLAPAITLVAGPAANACLASLETSFSWTASDLVSPRAALQFAWSLDGGPATPFGPDTTAALTGLGEGTHTLLVQALDERGHIGTLSRSFTIDTHAPSPFVPTARALDIDRVRFTCTGTDNTAITGFHLQVSSDATFATLLAEVDLGPAGVHDFTGAPGNTYYGRARAFDCANNTSAYSQVSNAASLANLANLLPTLIEVPTTATADQLMHIEWTVGNSGQGSANVAQWFDDIYLSPTPAFDAQTAKLLGRVQNLTALDPTDTYTLVRDLKLPVGVQGTWYAVVLTDVLGDVPETIASDNTLASSPIDVSLGTVADLVVTQLQAPLTALTEHTATLVWTVKNVGTGRTPVDRWFDTVMLSDDAVFNFQLVGNGGLSVLDTPLATFEHVGALEQDSSYTVTATVTVPALAGGSLTRWFVVASDLRVNSVSDVVPEGGAVFENLDERNARVADATEISVVQPADLLVDDVRQLNGTGAVSGGTMVASWKVRNGGFSPTSTSSWTDRILLSADATADVGDVILGDFPHGGALDLGDQYELQPNLRIPDGVTGNRFLIVITDIFGQVREFSDGNNSRASVTPVAITLSPWPNLRPLAGSAPDTAAAGRTLQVQWQVANLSPNGRALSSAWRDDVYLSPSPTWSPSGAKLLASVRTTQSLTPGQAYVGTATLSIPAELSGTHYAYVVTDAVGEIYEHTDEGDNLQRIATLFVKTYPPVDVAVSGVSASPAAVSTGDALVIDWQLTNLGEAATLATSWPEQVWLSPDTLLSPDTDLLLPQLLHGGALLAGATATGHVSLTVPAGISGSYHVLLRSDPGGSTGDGVLANNTGATAFPVEFTAIAAPPAPNLALTALTAPASANSGQPIDITVDVRNLGPGGISGRSHDVTAYLSLDTRLDGTDITLGSVTGPATLPAGATSGVALGLTLPNYVSGAYFLLVGADSRNEISEANESDNFVLQPLLAILPPPSDLIVTNVQVSAPTVTPGQPMTVTYTLENVGANPAVGRLDNAIYLSADTTFDSVLDPLVGLEQVIINLLHGQSVTLKQTVAFRALPLASLPGGLTGVTPPLTPGPYHTIVRANVRQSIRESNGDNNARVSAATVDGRIPDLAIGVPQGFDLLAGQSAFFRVAVPAGQDLTITTTSDVGGATNELFVAFGHTPTGSDFEFAGPSGFTATPSVLVPGTRAGDYFLLIAARSLGTLATTEHMTVHAQLLPFSLTAHTPAVGGAGGQVTGRVRGAGLRDSTVLSLEKAGLPVATARLARFVNSTDMLVRWDLRGVALDTYDVVAINGTDRVVLPGAFTVEPARVPAVAIETDQSDVLRRNAVAPFTFTFRNTSNQDVEVLRGRILYPASSVLRAVVTSPDLLSRSERAPALFAPVSGDAFVAHDARTGDSLAVVDVVGGHLAPGEARTVSVSVSGLETSPYSVLAMAGTSTARDFLDREAAYAERARRALLASPQGVPAELLALAGNDQEFRLEALRSISSVPGILEEDAVDRYLTGAPSGLPLPVADPALEGPVALLAEALAGGCTSPNSVPECVVDVAPVACALPGCRVVYDTQVPVALTFGGGAIATVAGSTARGYSEFVCADAKVVAPCDPNVISGPIGFGADRWWSAEKVMNFKVDFENLSGVAAAPAQVVRVTVPLDDGFELGSFRLGSAGFGGANGKIVGVPLNRTAFDNGGIFYSDLGLYVQYTASIDPATRIASFVFSTLGLDHLPPSNAYVGFLPVNDATGRGQGFVTFSIKSRANITPGVTLPASASIKFDQNTPVPTNVITNRIDSQKPLSGVTPAFEVLDATHLRIRWLGQDDATGSGLKGYSVFLSRDSGPFNEVGALLSSNAMELNVEDGHQYAFYSRATDNTDNIEPDKNVPDQLVTVGSIVLGSDDPKLPRVTLLHQNAPNPWRGTTLIRFDLASASDVTLEVFDVQGRIVAKPLDHKRLQPGRHAVPLDRLRGGPGVYFYRMTAKSFTGTRRMVRLN